eukprot:c25313_g1_i2 orf=457-2898(+)
MATTLLNTILSSMLVLGMLALALGGAVGAYDQAPSSSANVEAQALMAFKKGITTDPLGVLASWDAANSSTPAHPCTAAWRGIACDEQKQHVTRLNLAGLNLAGSISPSLALLPALSHLDLSYNLLSGSLPGSLFRPHSALQHLNLSFNLLSGALPDSLANLSALLTLDLSFNHFVGEIPPSLGHCKSLQRLYLEETGLTGRIPPEILQLPALIAIIIFGEKSGALLEAVVPEKFASCPSIRSLALSNVDGTGSPFPSSLGDCQQLRVLFLDVIGLEGSIPPETWQLPLLQVLVVQDTHVASSIDSLSGHPTSKLSGHPTSIPFKLHGSMPSSLRCCQTITELGFDGVDLTGEIPPSLGQCTALQFLDLSHGSLQGVIPHTLSNLSNLLHLHLQSNNLKGRIPESLYGCSSLESLRLGDNPNLGGVIPRELGELKNLQVLSLFTTSTVGPIPEELCNCTELVWLDLSENNLIGNAPKSLENCSNLQTLRLFNNNLIGRIEQFDLSKLQQLTTFTVHHNNFIGSLPGGFTSRKKLVLFDVQNNNLSGPLPSNTELHGLLNLRVLVMSSNKLSGQIPGWVWKLPMLQVLDLSNNRFHSTMPTTVTHLNYFKQDQSRNSNQTTLYEEVPQTIKFTFQVLTYILNTRVFIDLSMNNLEGDITESFGDLLSLTGLNLSHNNIVGRIPASLGKLTNLDVLDLSHNNLTGGIPQELGQLGGLSTLDLSYNHLQGPIPTTNNLNTRYNYTSFEGNPSLCGTPLPKNCSKSPITNTYSEPIDQSHAWSFIDWIDSFASPWALLITYPIGFLGGIYIVHRLYHP